MVKITITTISLAAAEKSIGVVAIVCFGKLHLGIGFRRLFLHALEQVLMSACRWVRYL